MSLSRLEGVLGLRRAKHLLRRASFKFSIPEQQLFASLTAEEAVELLITNPAPNIINEPYDYLPSNSPDGHWTSNVGNPYLLSGQVRKRIFVTAWWWYNAAHQLSLKHKLSFFLHTVFTVSKDDGGGAAAHFYDHLKLLDFYSFGNLKELSKKITLDNAMLYYLDNTFNNSSNPNENYAREFLELFTILKGEQIGEGNYTNYTELDVQEAAKVFSGFKINRDRDHIDPETGLPTSILTLWAHDWQNDKTFSSAFGNATIQKSGWNEDEMMRELEDFIEMVFSQFETARAYARRLYRYFVKSTWDETVESTIIESLAQTLYDANYDLLPAVRQLLKSQHFFDAADSDASDQIIGGIVKNPLQLINEVCSLFSIEIPNPDHSQTPSYYYHSFFRNFIHNSFFAGSSFGFFAPDTVAGYPAYYQAPDYDKHWFSSNTIITRYKLIQGLILGKNIGNNTHDLKTSLDMVSFVENNFNNPQNANALIINLSQHMYPENIDADRINYFKDFLVEGFDDYYWENAWQDYLQNGVDTTVKNRLNALITAMVNAPEFQLM